MMHWAKAGQNALAYKMPPLASPMEKSLPGAYIGTRRHEDMINLPQETEALAQRLALAKRLSVEEVIRLAHEDKVRAEGIKREPGQARDPYAEAMSARRARTDKLVAALAAMPVLDHRSPRDIMDD